MKKYFNSLMKSVLVVSAVAVLASCNDTWNDHYSYKTDSSSSVMTLAETIESLPGTERFVKVLKTTLMYNEEKQLPITYWELLDGDQFFTVWVPDANSVPDSIWAMAEASDKDHLRVGKEFILNHVARFRHPVGSKTKEKVLMMSDKAYRSYSDNMGGIQYKAGAGTTNVRCTNGIIHLLNGYVDYRPSIYEYITTSPAYKDVLGNWFASYTEEVIDPKKSVAKGANADGEMEYVDSVMVKTSILMNKYGYINVEDSNYAVVLPTPELWAQKYEEIKPHYQYGVVEKDRDSLQNFWTQSAMLTDMFFNMNIQKGDSVVSTLFSKAERKTEKLPYHVFQKPNAPGGLFADRVDSVNCSNGVIYLRNTWPYVDTLTYLRTIKVEAEDVRLSGFETTPGTLYTYDSNDNRIEYHYMKIHKDQLGWKAKYMIADNLKGKYTLKLVILQNRNDNRPNELHPTVYYYENTKATVLLKPMEQDDWGDWWERYYFTTGALCDTIVIGDVEFPTCNYKTNNPRVEIEIENTVSDFDSEFYAQDMWLDCIILQPVVE